MNRQDSADSKRNIQDLAAIPVEVLNKRLSSIITQSADGILVVNQNGEVLFANPTAEQMLGRQTNELVGQIFGFPIWTNDTVELDLVRQDKKPIQADMRVIEIEWESEKAFLVSLHDITAYRKLQMDLSRKNDEINQLLSSIPDLLYSLELNENGMVDKFHYVSPVCERMSGYPPQYFMEDFRHWSALIWREDLLKLKDIGKKIVKEGLTLAINEYRITGPEGEPIWVKDKINVKQLPNGNFLLDGVISDISDQKQREQEMQSIIELSEKLRGVGSIEKMFTLILNHLDHTLKLKSSAIVVHDDSINKFIVKQSSGEWESWKTQGDIDHSEEFIDLISKQEQYLQNVGKLITVLPGNFEIGNIQYISLSTLIAHKLPFGAIIIGRNKDFTESDFRIFRAASDIAANAIHRVTLYQQTENRMRRLMALRSIDIAITSSMDLNVTLDIFLTHVLEELSVDAACVLLINSSNQLLEFQAGQGFTTKLLQNTQLHLNQDRLGHILVDRKPLLTSNINYLDPNLPNREILMQEGVAGYHFIPLVSKGVIKGALEIYHRQALHPTQDWLEFAEALASQAAIAIDNALLLKDMQHFSIELMLSYDATIEGWARAVSLRDKDTENHTRRVTELTIQLAKALKISENNLPDIRRGAILHDIGKLAIPDNILLKPGPLDEEEWDIMRKHPLIAYDLLSQVPFLRTALDIPLYHHEHWNGKGYPQGLSRNQIPLSARIFSVVDVWDALTSDRPYRHAWTEEKARDYIVSLSGEQFDPEVVKAFIAIIDAARQSGRNEPSIPNILIVDDEENVITSLERILRGKFNVFIAKSGDEALETLKNNPIEIILTDQRMPGLTGLDLLRRAQKTNPDVVGILISGYSDPNVLVDALNLGNVRGFINKPWDYEDLLHRLDEVVSLQKMKTLNAINSQDDGENRL
jgi:response regulator RpfG family c-di-GMP phosphodiesterase/PAS domain-containing protein